MLNENMSRKKGVKDINKFCGLFYVEETYKCRNINDIVFFIYLHKNTIYCTNEEA